MVTLQELYEMQDNLDEAMRDMTFDWNEIMEIELTNME